MAWMTAFGMDWYETGWQIYLFGLTGLQESCSGTEASGQLLPEKQKRQGSVMTGRFALRRL
jgi:hypothetical protein